MTKAALKNLEASGLNIHQNVQLAAYTTIGIGGRARFFAQAATLDHLCSLLSFAQDASLPVFVLGCGSNVIISDDGYDGLVIRNRAEDYRILHSEPVPGTVPTAEKRFATLGEAYYTTAGLNHADGQAPAVAVEIASGARLTPLMKKLFREGITGLQWFAGIPATLGGAIYMNLHGGEHYIGDVVQQVTVHNGQCQRVLTQQDMQFGYDRSVLHDTRETVLSAVLVLRRGDVKAGRAHMRDWARRKSLQPQRSAGCVFQNLNPEQQKQLALPTPSVGYILDQKLGLKGLRVGDAVLSMRHAAFIENAGNASARDVYNLVQLIRQRCEQELSLKLHLEIEFIGNFQGLQ